MKKIVFGCCLLVMATTSCGGSKKKIDPFETLTQQIDSLSAGMDTNVVDTAPVRPEVIPATADESFADFFYNFASNERFQHSRIVFPISYYKGKEVTRIAKDEWKYDPLFSREPVYTVLFDKEEEMEMEKDTAVRSVQVDWIYLKDRKVKRYYFQRINDSWFLEAINKEKLAHVEGGKEDFFDFYYRFANDSVFQSERLANPLSFVTVDPEDEFQILETTLDEGQWFSFRPPLMKERLTNVHYGQEAVPDTDTKIIEFKGFGNGFSNTLYFECQGGEWWLMQFEDLSD
ncbi:DUF4348 domain-containing protein [Bacteroides gallinaceum]|uniref:DUF4348 domain-containing protein n=1 Tax=Bacteroides gallinaceum TaxID=1462571 RepID=UPI0025A32579|nr:DUF4348 domain-containing protein [Bacteroides gallinaceum]MDM8155577.1 DUF4348 domain-containing protein [Bacteroides gallinaceum]